MKIKITYETADELEEALQRPLQYYIDQGARLKLYEQHPPYKQAYIAVNNQKTVGTQ